MTARNLKEISDKKLEEFHYLIKGCTKEEEEIVEKLASFLGSTLKEVEEMLKGRIAELENSELWFSKKVKINEIKSILGDDVTD